MRNLQTAIAELLAGSNHNFLSIEDGDGENIIQVTKPGYAAPNVQINVGTYPSSIEPATALADASIAVPVGAQVTEFEEECYFNLDVPGTDPAVLAYFVTELFNKLMHFHGELIVTPER